MATERVRDRALRALTQPWIAGLVVLLVYVGLSFLNDPGGYLGTDTGAKVATLDLMVERDTLDPAVGYWAEEWDPDGTYHPLYDTVRNADGDWINVSTLPMLVAAWPLYDAAGYRAALLLPMAGAIGAAFACRSVARQLADERAGWRAFWLVGLAGPMVVYALDLWEHSIGAGLMVASVAALLRASGPEGRWWHALAAGLALGTSASMRTETFVFALPAVGGMGLWLLWQRRPAVAVGWGALAVAGFAVPWSANAWLESWLGGNARSDRATGAAQQDVIGQLGERVREAGVTWFGVPGLDQPGSSIVGAVVVVLLAAAPVLVRRGERRSAVLCLAVSVALLAVVLLRSGLGFVPGALVASPVAALAVWTPLRTERSRYVLGVALAATAGIWAFQFLGGAAPQWGGRYILAPTLLLTTLGVVALDHVDHVVRRTAVATAVAVTIFGVGWLQWRSSEIASLFDDLAVAESDVVIVPNGFFVREGGPRWDDRLFLSLGRDATLDGAVRTVERSGHRTFAVLDETTDPPDLDARYLGAETLAVFDIPIRLHRYELR